MRSAAPRGIRSLRHPEGLRLWNVDHGVVMALGDGAEVAGDVGGVLSWPVSRVSARVILGVVGRLRRTVVL
jgi:hypothetical protein